MYEILSETEAIHWWQAARRNIVLDWMRERYLGTPIERAADVRGLQHRRRAHDVHALGCYQGMSLMGDPFIRSPGQT